MQENQSSQDGCVDLGHIIFSALLALGFQPSLIEKKERTQVNENIFKKINQKVGDQILYFLFVCINGQQASKVFRDCWPIYDKRNEAHFRSAAFEWFKNLNQSDDYNLKPVLVVSKASVTPTSNKFLPTVYTLTRIALHSTICRKASSDLILHLPVLATKAEHRKISMKLIRSLKYFHKQNYINDVKKRTKSLQLLSNKAKELVDKYRSLIAQREEVRKKAKKNLQMSPYVSQKMKENLEGFPSDLGEELHSTIKRKNEEIKSLWEKVDKLKHGENKAWPVMSSLIKGGSGSFSINGDDYNCVLNSDQEVTILQKNDISLYKENKLDLLAVFEKSKYVLKHILSQSKVIQNGNIIDDKDDIKKQQNCVKSLGKGLDEIKIQVQSLLPTLFQANLDLRKKIYNDEIYQVPSQDNYELCPPTPPLNLESNDTPPRSELPSPYQLIDLTPANPRKDCPNIKKKEILRNVLFKNSYIGLPSGHINAPHVRLSLPNKKHVAELDSPNVSLSSTLHHNSGHVTADSGCILNSGTDSLMQSLEKIDITPKQNRLNKVNAYSQYGLSPLTPIRYEALNVKNGEKIAHIGRTNESKTEIETSPISSGRVAEQMSLLRSRVNPLEGTQEILNSIPFQSILCEESSLNSPLGDIVEDDCDRTVVQSGGWRDTDVNSSIQTPIIVKSSPIVSRLLQDLTSFNSTDEKTKFETFARRLQKSRSDKDKTKSFEEKLGKSSDVPKKIVSTTLKMHDIETSKHNLLSNDQSHPPIQILGLNQNSSQLKSKFHETFSSCISSLESCLNSSKDYDFGNFSSSKDLLAKEFRTSKSPEEFRKIDLDGNDFCFNDVDFHSNLLPIGSVFDTVTESLVSGEMESELLLRDDVTQQVRRESISLSRRESIVSLGRRSSNFSSRRLSELFRGRFSLEEGNIFSESDSCLLSASLSETSSNEVF